MRKTVSKRLEPFRTRYSKGEKDKPTVLVALSLGVSSAVALSMIQNHRRIQEERVGRTGYNVVVAHIHDGLSCSQGSKDACRLTLKKFAETWPSLKIVEKSIEDSFGIRGQDGSMFSRGTLDNLMASLQSNTSREDFIVSLRDRLLRKIALEWSCTSIIYGDSTTRMAAKTLAETAKGRGYAIPWRLKDGVRIAGISYYFPMRDLMRSEIQDYVNTLSDLRAFLVQPLETRPDVNTQSSSKHVSIDQIMDEYFQSIELTFPGIVSNVVRTAGKLHESAMNEGSCHLCGFPTDGQGGDLRMDRLTLTTPEAGGVMPSTAGSSTCYGCARTVAGGKSDILEKFELA